MSEESSASAQVSRLIIAGSRTLPSSYYKELEVIVKATLRAWASTGQVEIVSGCAIGADKLGELFAGRNGHTVKRFPALWDKYGKAAGHIRNTEMASYADAAIVFIVDSSRGSADMVRKMSNAEKRCFVMRLHSESLKT